MLTEFKKNGCRYVIDQRKMKNDDFVFYKFEPNLKVYNFIVKKNGKNFFFKGNGTHSFDIPELFSACLAKEVGLNSVEQYPAVFIDKNGQKFEGVISRDYVLDRENTEIINAKKLLKLYAKKMKISSFEEKANVMVLCSFDDDISQDKFRSFNNIETHVNAIKMLVNGYNESNSTRKMTYMPNIAKELQKQLLFYYLISNEDSYCYNIEYQTIQKGQEFIIDVCPVFDNSYSFLLKSFNKRVYETYESLSPKALKEHVEIATVSTFFPFGVFQYDKYQSNRNTIASDIVKLLSHDKELLEFYNNLKNVDIEKLFTKLKVDNGYTFIKEKEIKIATELFKATVKQIERERLLQKSLKSINIELCDKEMNF